MIFDLQMTLKIDLKVKTNIAERWMDPHCPEQLLSEQFFCIRLTNGDI